MAKTDGRKYIEWERSDFSRHGLIATYALGGCRCVKCKKRYEDWEPWKHNTPSAVLKRPPRRRTNGSK